MIVLPDADIDMAADAAVSAAYGSAGERCMAVSQVVAVGNVAEPLIDAIKERIPKLKVGDGMDPSSEMGPLITAGGARPRRVVRRGRDGRGRRRCSSTGAKARRRTGSSCGRR